MKLPVLLLAFACVHLASVGVAASRDTRPNIVFILSDDHAVQAISCYGSKLAQTPQIDRLAAGGMRFDNAFCVESICSPSRAAIMTGKYGHITGAKGWAPYDRMKHQTFPEALQAAGYQTALFGKYHLGMNPPGFDRAEILEGQGRYRDPELHGKNGAKIYPGHVSEVITDLALGWLDERDARRPFLLLVHDKATHIPWEPTVRNQRKFADVTVPEPPTLFDMHPAGSVRSYTAVTVSNLLRWQGKHWPNPPAGGDDRERTRWLYQNYMRDYLATAQGIDDSVGQILDYLDRAGLSENTIVVYASDQGFFLGERGWFDKRWMLEESLRLPLIVRYPRMIRPATSNTAMVLNIDFAPTLLELAGMRPVEGTQGRSLRPLLEGQTPVDWRKSMYYRYYPTGYGIPPQLGVRTERYKLIHYKGPVATDRTGKSDRTRPAQAIDEWELFDLQTDPGETANLYHRPESQRLVREMKSELDRLRRELGDSAD